MNKTYSDIMRYSILAGIAISLGCTVFLSVDNKVIGSLLFSIGLLSVLVFRYNLFTGIICAPKVVKLKDYIISILFIWVFNFIGTLLFALIVRFTRIFDTIQSNASNLVALKMNDSLISLFLLGIICIICIYIAVIGYSTCKDSVKYILVIFGVMVFIICGSEHCIADMYYWTISGVLFSDPLSSIGRIAIISLGNLVGAILMKFLNRVKQQ